MNAKSTEKPPKRFGPFDYLVFLGGLINLVVVTYIIGYWLTM